MNGNKDDILKKITKLLAAADINRGGTAEEVDTAMRLANKLMAEHNITMAEATKTEAKVTVTIGPVKAPRHLWTWEKRLAHVFNELCDVRYYLRKTGTTEVIVFVGMAEDIAVAASMYDIFRKQIHINGRKYGNHADHRSYGEGYVSACYQRAVELKAKRHPATESQALIFVGKKKTAVDAYFDNLDLTTRQQRTRASLTGAYYDGVRDGNAADLGTKKRLG